jgi:Mrp family chromosome partitioning ATPase
VAVVLAQTGRRVILVDTHLHESTIAKLFGMDQRLGLADILTGRTETLDLTPIDWLPYLSVVPSGLAPSNTFELLASTRMADLIEELESQADIVIIAAAPLLSYADSLVLASRVDEVLIVARSGQTHRATIGDVVKSLTSLNAYVAGAVLDYNQPPHQLALLWRITKSVGAERKSRDKDGILTNPT